MYALISNTSPRVSSTGIRFTRFLVLDVGVVLIQDDLTPRAHHLACLQDWLRDLQHLHIHTCRNPVDVEVHSLLAQALSHLTCR